MTHEFLALMLGVNRPTVTLSASMLQDAGLISYSRGVMTILDRPGLERSRASATARPARSCIACFPTPNRAARPGA